MKKWFFLFFCTMWILFSVSASASDSESVSLNISSERLQYTEDGEITISVVFSGVPEHIRTFGFVVNYNQDVFEFVKDSAEIVLSGWNDNITLVNMGEDGVFVFATTKAINVNGEIVRFKLKLKKNISFGKQTISVSQVILGDSANRRTLRGDSKSLEIYCTHNYNTYAKIDGEKHELSCSICHSSLYELHTFDQHEELTPSTHTTYGREVSYCKCGIKWQVSLPLLPEHTFSQCEAIDDNDHLWICDCGEKKIDVHHYGDALDYGKNSAGLEILKYICADCGHTIIRYVSTQESTETTSEETTLETTTETTVVEETETAILESTPEETSRETGNPAAQTETTSETLWGDETTENSISIFQTETVAPSSQEDETSFGTVLVILAESMIGISITVYLIMKARREYSEKKEKCNKRRELYKKDESNRGKTE